MSANQDSSPNEVEQLRARVATLEQLLEAQEQTVNEQAQRLEQSLKELRQRADDQAASETALREQTRILQSILDSMGDGVIVADENGRFFVFNPAAEQILGIGATDTPPADWSERYRLFLPDMTTPFPPAEVPLARAIRGESVTGVELFIRAPHTPEGVWISANARPLRDETGAVRGGVVVFGDISQRVRSAQRRTARLAVTTVLAGSATLHDAVSGILQAVCQNIAWEVGTLWTVDERSGKIGCFDAWYAGSPELAPFVELTRRTTFKPGDGLPGRVWAERAPAWITDLVDDRNFPRTSVASRCGLHSAFAFPILLGGVVIGVIEFFSRERRQRDDDLQAMIGSLGSQVGQFLERKQTEEALRKERERFELCVRGSGDGVWDWEIDTNRVYFSPRWKQMLGYSDAEVSHRYEEWEKRLHPDDRERALTTLQAYLDGKTPIYELEHRLMHKDGTYRWILARGVALRDAAGRPYRMAGSHTDMTERKQMEERLRDEEALYHSLVETLPLNVFRKDLAGRVTFGNQRYLDTLRMTREQILGKTDFDLFPVALARKYVRDDVRVQKTGEVFRDVEEHRRPDGETIYVEVLKAPVYDARGNIVGIEGIFWDVTKRKRDEEELRKAMEEAEAANRAKSAFLANMSHEIRTPMNAIIGMTELVLDTALVAEQRECLETVRKAADHLLTVINDILDFSKIEAGKLDIDHAGFRLRECLEDTVGTLALPAHQQGLELALRIPPEVPDALIGDPSRLRQVLVNLINNAIKFTEMGEVVVRVAVDEQTEESAILHFEITDTGIGIPPDKMSSIFAPFVQVDGSLTRKRGGTGLGLAISRRLVEIMGGHMGAESVPGRGSRFHFSARFGIQRDAAAGATMTPLEPGRMRGLAVLIVDDNATNRFILEEILSGWRMRPTAVASGPEALAALREAVKAGEPYPLVLVDAHMPEMDGFTLARHIRQRTELEGVQVVMLTSGGQTPTAARRQELGLAACLPKPVRQADLYKTLAIVLGGAAPSAKRVEASAEVAPLTPRRLRILLAEDNPINQNLAVRLLAKAGHDVFLAANGREAVAALEDQSFDLVLMDLQMPEMDGLEATTAIRARERETGTHVPIIAMTAFAMTGDKEKCLEAGMDSYISKPVRARELFDTINQIASHAEAGPVQAEQRVDPDGVDWAAALDYVGGDEQMLREMIDIFLDEAPRWMAELRQAIAAHNVPDVKRLAHNFKGSARLFGAKSVADSAFLLEQMGRNGNLSGADAACAALETAIDRLKPALVGRMRDEG
jgi:PAS domain S-box-containing protein